VKLQQLCKLIDDVSGRAILFLSFEVVVMPNDHGQLMCQVILHNPAASKPHTTLSQIAGADQNSSIIGQSYSIQKQGSRSESCNPAYFQLDLAAITTYSSCICMNQILPDTIPVLKCCSKKRRLKTC
jgi:hypothetical protein